MILLLLLLILVYGLVISGLFASKCHRDAHDSYLINAIETRKVDGLTPLEQVQALSQLAEARYKIAPWYEKSFSAIGVAAFFSMVVATGFQTVRSGFEASQVQAMQKEVATLTAERLALNNSIGEICHSIEESARELGHLEPAGRKILNTRLLFLKYKDSKTDDDIIELFDVALLLQDYATARSVITDQNLNLLDKAKPGDVISLAERAYFEDSPNAAKDYLARVQPQVSQLPVPWQVRFVVLDAILNGDTEAAANQLSILLGIDGEEARRRLSKEILKLKTWAASPGSNPDPEMK